MSAGRFVCLVWCPILAASCTSPLLPESNGSYVTRILAAEPGPFVGNSNALFRIHVNPLEEEQDPDDPLCFPGLLLTVTSLTRIAELLQALDGFGPGEGVRARVNNNATPNTNQRTLLQDRGRGPDSPSPT